MMLCKNIIKQPTLMQVTHLANKAQRAAGGAAVCRTVRGWRQHSSERSEGRENPRESGRDEEKTRQTKEGTKVIVQDGAVVTETGSSSMHACNDGMDIDVL